MITGIVVLGILSLPAVFVSVLAGVLRYWRRLLVLLGAWALIFTVLVLLILVFVSARGEAPPGNTEPPFTTAAGFFYAAAIGVIAADIAALVCIPLLFAGKGRR